MGEEKVEMFYRLSPDQTTTTPAQVSKKFHYCISHRKSTTLDVIIVIVDLMLIVSDFMM